MPARVTMVYIQLLKAIVPNPKDGEEHKEAGAAEDMENIEKDTENSEKNC